MQSSTIGALAGALAKAQSKIKGAVKDSANPFFKSSYADLQSVWDACREPLTSNGLAVIQTTEETANGTVLVTTLAHSSGEWIQGRLPVIAMKNEPQAYGSAISYSRRYALASLVGVYQTDDDAEQAQARTRPVQQVVKLKEPEVRAPVKAVKPVEAPQAESGEYRIPDGQYAGKTLQELATDDLTGFYLSLRNRALSAGKNPDEVGGKIGEAIQKIKAHLEARKSE